MKIRNKNLKPALVEELKRLEETCFTFDKPVPFKEGIQLYPVTVEHYNEFLISSSCCTLNKNEDPEGITMTNLDYLITKLTDKESGGMWSAQLSRLMELTCHIKNGIKCKKCGKLFDFKEFFTMIGEAQAQQKECVCPDCEGNEFEEMISYKTDSQTNKKILMVNGVEIGNKDFDRFRQIVLYQNLPDYQDDSWVDASLKEDERQRQELIMKKNGGRVSATLEKKIVCVASQTNYKFEELYTMTMRKFIMLLTTVDDAMTYQCDRIGLMSGLVSSKKPLEHWIYKSDDSMYGSAVSSQEFAAKMNGGGNIKKK